MCCFSPLSAPASLFSRLFPPRVHVSATNIFARLEGDEQILVYAMTLATPQPVAMILPLPVAHGLGEAALRFVSLEKRPQFFEELASLFEVAQAARKSAAPRLSFSRPKLVVHRVGAFEASFVPTIDDFDRLDPRFRLPSALWRELGYDAAGFAVFQLAAGNEKAIHPMAFRFRTRERGKLFFPTVHVHDGTLHDRARFDHALFWQAPGEAADERSFLPAFRDDQGLLEPQRHVYRRRLRGKLPNRDTWIPLTAS